MIRVNLAGQGKGFLVLSNSRPSEAMDVGLDLGPNMAELYMAEASRLKLNGPEAHQEQLLNLLFLLCDGRSWLSSGGAKEARHIQRQASGGQHGGSSLNPISGPVIGSFFGMFRVIGMTLVGRWC